MSVCPSAWNNSDLTGRIFIKTDISAFFENLFRKLNIRGNKTYIAGTPHEDRCTFLITSRSFLLRTETFQTKFVEKMQTHTLFSTIPFLENRAVYEIMSENILQPERPQMKEAEGV